MRMNRLKEKLFLKVILLLTQLFFVLEKSHGQLQPAQSSPNIWQRNTLTGDWGGLRSKLANRGLHLEGFYIGDVFANVTGGVNEDAEYLDNIELKLLLDMQKIIGWQGGRILLYGLRNDGGSISADVGDAQGVNNIEAVSSFKLYEAWVQQNLFINRFSVLAGLYDVNSEFDVMQSAGLFINSSHGMGAEFAASGLVGPSTFPFTALSLRLRTQLNRSLYLQTIIADGVPGDPNDSDENAIVIRKEEGAFLAAELGWYLFKEDGSEVRQSGMETRTRRKHIGREVAADYELKLGVGVWAYTSNFELVRKETSTEFTTFARDKGIYALLDWRTYHEPQDKTQGLAIFLRLGFAEDDASRFNFYGGAGLVYTGLPPGRGEDEMGLALAVANNSGYFKSISPEPLDNAEITLEFTYRTQLAPWLAFQPDTQYVINPGTVPNLKNAFIFGIRFEITF